MQQIVDQMDAIKYLAEATGCLFVMVGTYELLNLPRLNDQMSRRFSDIISRVIG